MTYLYLLVGASVLVGVMNLVATILLSNAIFRSMNPPAEAGRAPDDPRESAGLVDPVATPTYDPRFRSEK
jgi:hypothetical protein